MVMATSSNEWALKSRKSKLLLVLFLHWRTPCSHESTDTACPGFSEQKHFQMKRQISCVPFLSFLASCLGQENKISSSQRAPQMHALVCLRTENLRSAVCPRNCRHDFHSRIVWQGTEACRKCSS